MSHSLPFARPANPSLLTVDNGHWFDKAADDDRHYYYADTSNIVVSAFVFSNGSSITEYISGRNIPRPLSASEFKIVSSTIDNLPS